MNFILGVFLKDNDKEAINGSSGCWSMTSLEYKREGL